MLGAGTKPVEATTFVVGLDTSIVFGEQIKSTETIAFGSGFRIPSIIGICGNVKFGLITESARSGENSPFSIKMTCVIS